MDEKKPQEIDLFNNPMVDAARKAMTPEQVEEYKRVGEYMYNSVNYQIAETGSKVKPPTEENLIVYAVEGLKAGLDPMDLSDEELRALIQVYGEEWYEKFDYTRDEVPKPAVQLVTAQDAQAEIDRQAKELNYSRQQRRAIQRKFEKEQKKAKKSKGK
jgi:hypothetical protein